MATQLEIVLLDGSTGDSSTSDDVAPGAAAVGVQGAPAVSQSQPERDPAAPQRSDFRDLKTAISDLAKRINASFGSAGATQPRTKLGPQELPEALHGSRPKAPKPGPQELPEALHGSRPKAPGEPPQVPQTSRPEPDREDPQETPQTSRPAKARDDPKQTTGPTPAKPQPKPLPSEEVQTRRKKDDPNDIGQSIGDAVGSAIEARLRGTLGRFARPVIAGARGLAARVGIGRAGAAAVGVGARTAGAAAGAGAGAGTAAGAGVSLATIGAIAAPVAIVVAALGTMAFAVKKTSDVLFGAANDLADLSGPISAAMAQNQARREIAQVERAQKIGPELAQLVRAQGRFDDAMDELKTTLLKELVKLAPLIEAGIDSATFAVKLLQVLKENTDVLVAFIPGTGMNILKELNEAIEAAREATEAFEEIFRTDNEGGQRIDENILRLLGLDLNEPHRPIVPPNDPAGPLPPGALLRGGP